MNKYSLQEHLQEELTPFTSTFKATSYDEEKDEYLCSDARTPHVYDFDAYVKEHCHHPTPASPDAIHVGSKDLYFVEFKNQFPGTIPESVTIPPAPSTAPINIPRCLPTAPPIDANDAQSQ